MSIAYPETRPVSIEEFLALPQEGRELELIEGEVKERPMAYRNRDHSAIVMTLGHKLLEWRNAQPAPQGLVAGGEVGCILRHMPTSTIVGIDVAYFSQATIDLQDESTTLIDGAPVVAVEVLSPSDQQKEINAKVRLYLAAGTAAVWKVDPEFRTITIHRPHQKPRFFTDDEMIDAQPELPGIAVLVADIFDQ